MVGLSRVRRAYRHGDGLGHGTGLGDCSGEDVGHGAGRRRRVKGEVAGDVFTGGERRGCRDTGGEEANVSRREMMLSTC